MKHFFIFINLILFLTSCIPDKKSSQKSKNILLYTIMNKDNNLLEKKNFNIISRIMESNLLKDLSKLKLIPISDEKVYVIYSKNSKKNQYISQQWTLKDVKDNETLLVTYSIPPLDITQWEFYINYNPLNKNDDGRKKRFIDLKYEKIEKNYIEFIYKDDKNLLIKFKKKSDTGYSFISYTSKQSIYSVKKCSAEINLCKE